MMNSDEIISIYESVASITEQMLSAARNSDWEHMAALESRCASHVRTLEKSEIRAALTSEMRERKFNIIQKILADDREIRNITEPWMAQLSSLINNTSTERKLSMTYGRNQAG
ncbi:MAG: flagellar protein FliT [Sulfuriferula sp.]|jgi:flagellar protein FliT